MKVIGSNIKVFCIAILKTVRCVGLVKPHVTEVQYLFYVKTKIYCNKMDCLSIFEDEDHGKRTLNKLIIAF